MPYVTCYTMRTWQKEMVSVKQILSRDSHSQTGLRSTIFSKNTKCVGTQKKSVCCTYWRKATCQILLEVIRPSYHILKWKRSVMGHLFLRPLQLGAKKLFERL